MAICCSSIETDSPEMATSCSTATTSGVAPGATPDVVAVEQDVAISGLSVSIDEQQIAIRERVELRVGDALLTQPRHALGWAEHERPRAHRSCVVQRLV